MRVLLIANGPVTDDEILRHQIEWADQIIAVDGGMRHLVRIDHQPNLWVGDMDSFDFDLEYTQWLASVKVLKYPVHKDASDTELAIDIAMKSNPTDLVMMGMLGARIDHTLANLGLLKPICQKGIRASIRDADQIVYYINEKITLKGLKGKTISLSPITNLEGVTITGCEYPLSDDIVSRTSSLGLSNKAVDDVVTYHVKSGEAYIIVSNGN
jgi:thiamine pyrophosphokinase